MESTVKQRLIEFIKFKNLTVHKFETFCGFANGFVRNMAISMRPDKAARISSKFPELNKDWLLYGEGEMIKTSQNEQSVGDISGSYVVGVNLNGTNIRVNADRMDSFHSLVETVKDMQRTLEALRKDMEILIKHFKNDE